MKRERLVLILAIAMALVLSWTTWNHRAEATADVDLVYEDVIAATESPLAWIGTPEIVGQSIEVDEPVIVANETSYTQTVTYRQVIEYQVQMGIELH